MLADKYTQAADKNADKNAAGKNVDVDTSTM